MQQLKGQNPKKSRVESVVYEDLFRNLVVDFLIEKNEFELVPAGTLTPEDEAGDTPDVDVDDAEGSEAVVDVDAETAEAVDEA